MGINHLANSYLMMQRRAEGVSNKTFSMLGFNKLLVGLRREVARRPEIAHLAQPLPEWLTSTVHALASQRDSAINPVLADALQDAGCSCQHLLDHLYLCQHNSKKCWVHAYLLRDYDAD